MEIIPGGSTDQMVADVQAWLDNSLTNFGWIIRGDESQRSTKQFSSKDHDNASRRPVLTITFTS